MEKIRMCRICLSAEDTQHQQQHLIVTTHLQEMYEILTMMPFDTKDRRPVKACNTCSARLENCYILRKQCLQAEETFTQMLSGNFLEPEKNQDGSDKQTFSINQSTIQNSMEASCSLITQKEVFQEKSVGDKEKDTEMLCNVKIEPLDIDEMEDSSENTVSNQDYDIRSLPSTYEVPVERIKQEPEEIVEIIKQESEAIETDNLVPAKFNPASETSETDDDTSRPTAVPLIKRERPSYANDSSSDGTSTLVDVPTNSRECVVKGRRNIYVRHHCEFCNKIFIRNGDYVRHVRRHTGERPYQCIVCKKGFVVKSALVKHIRTHTGERPFQCDVCDKSFGQKNTLDVHMRTHTGDRRYPCNLCDKLFAQKGDLKKHMQTRKHLAKNDFIYLEEIVQIDTSTKFN